MRYSVSMSSLAEKDSAPTVRIEAGGPTVIQQRIRETRIAAGKALGAATHMEKLAARLPSDTAQHQILSRRAGFLRDSAAQMNAEISALSVELRAPRP
jgi:hypothetical protein